MDDAIESRRVTCGHCLARIDELFDDLTSGRGGVCPHCGVVDGFAVHVAFKPIVVNADLAATFVGKRGTKTVLKGFARKDQTTTGDQAGTRAWVEQIVDKTFKPGRYSKRVTLADGTVIKDADGPLTDQGLHGRQEAADPGPGPTEPEASPS